jgi:hypothetical protein
MFADEGGAPGVAPGACPTNLEEKEIIFRFDTTLFMLGHTMGSGKVERSGFTWQVFPQLT